MSAQPVSFALAFSFVACTKAIPDVTESSMRRFWIVTTIIRKGSAYRLDRVGPFFVRCFAASAIVCARRVNAFKPRLRPRSLTNGMFARVALEASRSPVFVARASEFQKSV